MKRISLNTVQSIILGVVLFSCQTREDKKERPISDTAEVTADSTQQIIRKDTVKVASLLAKGNIKVLFNKKDETLNFIYKSGEIQKTYEIGRYSNTFGDPPEVELKDLDENNVGILITTNLVQLGQSADALAFYSFNIKTEQLKELCVLDDIAVHDMQMDTLQASEITYYDYFIDNSKNQIVVKEYSPYKSLTNKKVIYKTRTRTCSYKLK
jgi:hypothetical protein